MKRSAAAAFALSLLYPAAVGLIGCEERAPSPQGQAASPAPATGSSFVIGSRLKLRAKADDESKVIATLPLNAEVSVAGESGAWREVKVLAPAPLKGKQGFLANTYLGPSKLTVAMANAKAKSAADAAAAMPWLERAYTLSPSKATLKPLMTTLRELDRHDDAEHFANLLRTRQLSGRLPAFAMGKLKELTLMFAVGNTPGTPWTVASGECDARLGQCPLVQFGRTQLSPVTMTCDEPSPLEPKALLEKAKPLREWEQSVGALADKRGRGLLPLKIDSMTVVDLNEDKRPDKLYVVSLQETAAKDKQQADELPPYSCLLAEVNGGYQMLDGLLCGERMRMFPAQAFTMQEVPGTLLRVEQQLMGARGAFLAHFGKGVLAEVRAGCSGNG